MARVQAFTRRKVRRERIKKLLQTKFGGTLGVTLAGQPAKARKQTASLIKKVRKERFKKFGTAR